jgi:hypothetical protein
MKNNPPYQFSPVEHGIIPKATQVIKGPIGPRIIVREAGRDEV